MSISFHTASLFNRD